MCRQRDVEFLISKETRGIVHEDAIGIDKNGVLFSQVRFQIGDLTGENGLHQIVGELYPKAIKRWRLGIGYDDEPMPEFLAGIVQQSDINGVVLEKEVIGPRRVEGYDIHRAFPAKTVTAFLCCGTLATALNRIPAASNAAG